VFVGPSKGVCNPSPSVSQPLVSTDAERTALSFLCSQIFASAIHHLRDSSLSFQQAQRWIALSFLCSRSSQTLAHSCFIMQTALCYLEVDRPRVPEILRDERSGVRVYSLPKSAILPATEVELLLERKMSNSVKAGSDKLHCVTSRLTVLRFPKFFTTRDRVSGPILCPSQHSSSLS